MKHESHAGTEKYYEISGVLQWGEMKSHIRAVAHACICQDRDTETKKRFCRDCGLSWTKPCIFLGLFSLSTYNLTGRYSYEKNVVHQIHLLRYHEIVFYVV